MPTVTRTADQIAASLARAVDAVARYYAHESHNGYLTHQARVAREEIGYAMRMDGHTVAAIAAASKTAQLLVARLAPPEAYASALVNARHDAERSLGAVMEAIRNETLRRWDESRAERGTKSRLARELGVSRPVLDEWIAAHDPEVA